MPDIVFNRALGSAVQLVLDNPNSLGMLLLSAVEGDADLGNHVNLSTLLGAAGNTEVADASYGRKTALTGTVTQDDTNDRTDIDVPDQTWAALAGPDPVKLLVFVEITAAETGRIPLTSHDFAVTSDGTDVTAQVNANGFYRAAA